MKRLLAFFIAFIILLSIVPTVSFAAENDKMIALTFDDGPSSPNTERLLDGLRELNAHCTFFLVGYVSEYHKDLIKQMWEDGHQIASHTYDHPMLTKLSEGEIYDQLNTNKNIFNDALGFECDYMLRPPYGDFNDFVLSVVHTPCFYWSMDTQDWQNTDPDVVYQAFLDQVQDGSIALLHDSHESSVDAALHAVETLQKEGYEFVTLEEMFMRRGITLTNGKMYYNAYPGDYGTDDKIADPVIKCQNGKISIFGDERGEIYYTTNGEIPNPTNSKLYTGPLEFDTELTLTAVSVLNWNGLRSDAVTKDAEFISKTGFTPIPMADVSPVEKEKQANAIAWIFAPLVTLIFFTIVIIMKARQINKGRK